MSETYPIVMNGGENGVLTVARKGLITEFTGRCRDPGRLFRLSVYGEGAEGYLGVMEPVGGELYLCRKLSRTAMAYFPGKIEYAAEAGGTNAPAPPPRQEETAAPRPGSGGRPGPRQRQGKDLIWYSAGDGSLYTVWNGRSYRAIPMAAWGLPLERAVERRTIDGVEYAVFALENGQIV